MIQQHRFIHEGTDWYIDLPRFLEQGGSKGDLQMVAGADELTLTERCDPVLGGGYYHLKSFEGSEVVQDMWLCEVTRFVFDDIPEKIFIKRVL